MSPKWTVTLPASTEYIYLCLLQIFNDPNISFYTARLSSKAYIKDPGHQTWHESLRLSTSKRWEGINDLYKKRNFQKMPGIPIDFPLPYASEKWRAHKTIMKKILFFRKGFMRIETTTGSRNMTFGEMMENVDELDCMNYPDKDITEAYGDFLLFTNGEENSIDEDWVPYVLKEGSCGGMRIIN